MGKKLVVVESPAKAKTINKILGSGYVVEASMGHIRDLPVRSLGVDIENGFQPKYEIIKGRRKVVDKLQKRAADCDAVYLAPDPDREGEAIAWHLEHLLSGGKQAVPVWRVQYNEITPTAVRRAFDNPSQVNVHRVEAQQARRILDRLVGYMVSPMLWRRIRRGLSAGRVQSVALRLVCEREAEITAFVPEAYWIHGARVRKVIAPLEPFRIKLYRIDGEKPELTSEEASATVLRELEGRALKVTRIDSKTINKRPPPPYITSTLQQAGSSYFSFSPKRTMRLAQTLYEGVDFGQGPVGLITYMRTDSVQLSQDAVMGCRQFIKASFGAEYCPDAPNRYRSRSSAQEAHEAIRPTDVTVTPDSLKGKIGKAELNLYGLIWRRFVACQMAAARLAQRTITVEAVKPPETDGRAYLFQGSATDVVFPGYMRVAGSEAQREKREDAEGRVPEVREGEPLECIEWLAERKETQPPPRYSETSLVGALERHGVGRPSTYAQIIATLFDRTYVEHSKRSLAPTDLGMEVNTLLVSSLGSLFDVSFTAGLEAKLDQIEHGEQDWAAMLKDFYSQFSAWLEKAKVPPAPHDDVLKVLSLLDGVETWTPEVQRGKRKYSDERFVKSVREQDTKGVRKVSQRQLQTLVGMACKYRNQLPDVERKLAEMGYGKWVEEARQTEPRATTLRKLELLESVVLDASARDFVASLRKQTNMGRALSEAQLRVLDRIILGAHDRIPDYDAVVAELNLQVAEMPVDEVSKPLLDALASVETWRPPSTRGKRTFDDQAFYTSLTEHYARKSFLSEKQQGALKRMAGRYRDQITGYDELASRFGIGRRDAAQDAE